jgi:hypothetical protein
MTVMTPKEYAEHLATAGKRLHPQVTKVINRGAMNVRDDWKARATAANPVHARKYASTIRLRRTMIVDGVVTAVVEPTGFPSAKFGTILELGGPHNAPQLSHVEALKAEVPNLVAWLGKAAGQCL